MFQGDPMFFLWRNNLHTERDTQIHTLEVASISYMCSNCPRYKLYLSRTNLDQVIPIFLSHQTCLSLCHPSTNIILDSSLWNLYLHWTYLYHTSINLTYVKLTYINSIKSSLLSLSLSNFHLSNLLTLSKFDQSMFSPSIQPPCLFKFYRIYASVVNTNWSNLSHQTFLYQTECLPFALHPTSVSCLSCNICALSSAMWHTPYLYQPSLSA